MKSQVDNVDSILTIVDMFMRTHMCVWHNDDTEIESIQSVDVVSKSDGVEVLFNGSMLIDNNNITEVKIINDNTLSIHLTKEYGLEGDYTLTLYKTI
ncbi:MAG: hypothetical protein DRJ64_07330 [Thermoprotei archaeon]|nr:MAG: hypothetical protein DRJ64_07330 [Thermoprotei archaeon]